MKSFAPRFLLALVTLFYAVACENKKAPQPLPQATPAEVRDNDPDGYSLLYTKNKEAEALYQDAQDLLKAGKSESALPLLLRVRKLDPQWALPLYDLAEMYLSQRKTQGALSTYLELDRLMPKGLYGTKTAIWSLRREMSGEFPTGTYLAFYSREINTKIEPPILDHLVKTVPDFAPALSERAKWAKSIEERIAYLDRAMALEPDDETYGDIVMNRAATMSELGDKEGGLRLVNEFFKDPKATAAAKANAGQLWRELDLRVRQAKKAAISSTGDE